MSKIVFVNFNKKNKTKKVEKKIKQKRNKKEDILNNIINSKKKNHIKKILNYKFIVPIVIILTGIIYSMDIDSSNIEYIDNGTTLVNQSIDNLDYVISEYTFSEENKSINIYYPVTKYEKLNSQILSDLNNRLEEYKTNNAYIITGDFDFVNEKGIISISFNISIDLNFAHPILERITINYDIEKDVIIDINTLIKNNNEILNVLSEYCYNKLLENEKIKNEKTFEYMLKQGTIPQKENFLNIIYKENEIEIIFEPYQVAPYYLGEFRVLVPYEVLH